MSRAILSASQSDADPPHPADPAAPQPPSPAVETPSHGESGKAVAVIERAPATSRPTPKLLPPYNVILLDDDDHTYDYIAQMLRSVFGYAPSRGLKLAHEVDSKGRAIVLTTHKELAELKRDQIMGFGADPQLSSSTGSMRAVIELAPQ